MKEVITTCPYCGCGCRLKYLVEEGKVVKTLPVEWDPVSRGKPCIKGLFSHESVHRNRIVKPMIRRSKDAQLKEATWDEAYELIKERVKGIDGKDMFFSGSGEYSNEDNYIMQKFARVVFDSNNIDCCARLCHSNTTYAFDKTFGLTASPTKMEDLMDRDVVLAVGTNPATNYPVFFQRMVQNRGLKTIMVSTSPNPTDRSATLILKVRPGSITAVLSGFLNYLIKRASPEMEAIEGFSKLAKSVEDMSPQRVVELSGIPLWQFVKAAEMIYESKKFAVMHGMGLTQYPNGSQSALAIADLAILKKGKVTIMRGKCNVQGAGDMGCCPTMLPFGGDPELQKKYYGREINNEPGLTVTEAFIQKPVKVAFIMGMNPAHSLPELNTVHENMKNMFIVFMHHHVCKTMEFADVVLPSSLLLEKEGTITNGERRVRRLYRVIEPPGGKQDWQILCDIAKMLGHQEQFSFKDEAEIFNEACGAIPAYNGLSWDAVSNSEECFADKSIKFKRLQPIDTSVPDIRPDEEYPFILTTARSPFHFCTGELSRSSDTLVKHASKPYCYLNKKMAKNLGIKDGDRVRIKSRVGEVVLEVRIDEEQDEDYVYTQYHFESVLVNKLFPADTCDPRTMTPNYKCVPVKIEKI